MNENLREKELEELKKEYLETKMPKEQFDKLKAAMEKGKAENKRERRRAEWRRLAASAAVLLLSFVLLPNTSPHVALAMEKLPVLGNLVQLVTWRSYSYEDERNRAEITVSKLEITEDIPEAEGESDLETAAGGGARELSAKGKSAARQKLRSSVQEINQEMEEITNKLVQEFEVYLEEELGYQDILVQEEVVTSTPEYFTLKLICYQGAGSGYEWNYYYTIDLNTGERLQLCDLFVEGADYITRISDNIKKQMGRQMDEDENVIYWLDEEVEEWNFQSITDETSFYIREDGELVISFNEGDVAPMYMGVVEFVIEPEAIQDIMK